MKNLRKNKKGFTLVEVIVVLVILAILIAIAVPSVMKYIDDANNAKYEAQARGAMVAAESAIVVDYSDGDKIVDLDKVNETVTKEIAIGTITATPYSDKECKTAWTSVENATQSPNEIKAYKIVLPDATVTIVKNGKVTVE